MSKEYFNDALVNKVKEEAINDLIKILKFKTILDKYEPNSKYPFGKENKLALEFMKDLATKDNFDTLIVDNHAMHIEFNKNKEELCGILAHMDVVPVSDTWLTDPFNPVIKDGKIFARGTIDNKGPLMACYYALKLIKEANLPISKSVRLIIGSDEESGSRCLKHYFKFQQMPNIGFSPDASFPLIHGEKARITLKVTSTYKGVVKSFNSGQRINIVPDLATMTLKEDYERQFLEFLKENNYKGEVKDNTYFAYGKSAHAMSPNLGQNASFILFAFLTTICEDPLINYIREYLLFDNLGEKLKLNYQDDEMGITTMNLGLVTFKDDVFTLDFDLRLPFDDKEADIKQKVNSSLKNYPNMNIDIDFSDNQRHYVKKDSYLVNTLMNVYQEVTNDYESKAYTIGGGTYAKFIPNCVAYGPVLPNKEDVIHQDNEYIFIDDFVLLIKLYAKAIYELIK